MRIVCAGSALVARAHIAARVAHSAESPFELAPIDLATGDESDEARPRPMFRSMD